MCEFVAGKALRRMVSRVDGGGLGLTRGTVDGSRAFVARVDSRRLGRGLSLELWFFRFRTRVRAS